MEIQLRREQEADYRETENVTREAFWNRYAPGCDEHYLLHVMRDCPDFVKELDYVAVDGDRIVGNIIYMKAVIHGDDGHSYEVLTLGPVSVLPDYQRKGIGRMLIIHTRQLAAQLGFRAILLCGDPDIYTHVGFILAAQADIRTADDVYFEALHVCGLQENALQGLGGRYVESGGYAIDPAASAAFDQTFPPKERTSGTPTQLRFAELLTGYEQALARKEQASDSSQQIVEK